MTSHRSEYLIAGLAILISLALAVLTIWLAPGNEPAIFR